MHNHKISTDIPQCEFASRCIRLQQWQKKQKLDAVLILSEINRYYYTGLTASNGVLLSILGEQPVFLTDFRYLTAARELVNHLEVRELWQPGKEHEIIATLAQHWQGIGYEGNMPVSRFLGWQGAAPHVKWQDISGEITAQRRIKSHYEQQALRSAIAMADTVLQNIIPQIKPGISEQEISWLIERKIRESGLTPSFDTIVCIGRNGAECHHQPAATRLHSTSQPLLIDMGVRQNHYCSDITRTFVLHGKPSALLTQIHAIVLEANQRAIAAIAPGKLCGEIDTIARGYIEKAGYGRFFGHSLGHALGLEVHEQPVLKPQNTVRLAPGMILTVEPGIYLPGKLGVRIEDVVLVTKTGCEVLTDTPRNLLYSAWS